MHVMTSHAFPEAIISMTRMNSILRNRKTYNALVDLMHQNRHAYQYAHSDYGTNYMVSK